MGHCTKSKAIISIFYAFRKSILKECNLNNNTLDGFDRDLLIATHEAGHAVVCHVLGYDFISITIEPNELIGSDGAFIRSPLTEANECGRLSKEGQNRWMCDKIKITLGGGLAVYQLTNNRNIVGMTPDLNSAWDLARMLVKDEVKATELNTALSALTIDLLKNQRNWAAIISLSNELIKRRTIKYDDAVKIINKAFYDFESGMFLRD